MSVSQGDMPLNKVELRLRDGRIGPLFRKYAIPGVIALLFVGLQTVIDGVILGNFVGANAMASVSLVLPCYTFISAMAIVIGVGCQTVVSIRLGQQNRQGASDALRSAFVFLILFTFAGSLLLYTFAPQMVRLFGGNDVLLPGSIAYLRALVPFFPMVVIMFFSDYLIKALGRPVYSMAVMGGTVIMNIVLDLLFVTQWGMGTAGAGLATGLAFTMGALFNFPMVLRNRNGVSLRKGRYNWRLVWQMMYNGSSEGISELSAGISAMLFNLALMSYVGENGVAAFTAINYVAFIFITVFLGISDGIIPIVSYNYGAGKWERIRSVMLLAGKTNFAIGLGLFVMLLTFGRQIISLFFRSEDAGAILDMAAHGTCIYAFAFLINGFNILASSYFTAIANAKLSVVISALRGLVFVSLGVWLLPLFFGIDGIWFAVPIAELGTLAVSVLLVRRSFRRRAAVRL